MAVVDRLNTLPSKTLKRIATYVNPDIFTALEEWAEEEDRSISNLTSRLLTQAVEAAKRNKFSDRTNSKKS